MTVLAWDGKTLAADKRCDIGGTAFTGTKVRRLAGGAGVLMPETLMGFCGTASLLEARWRWYCAGANPDTYPKRPENDDSAMVCITKDEAGIRIRRYEATGDPLPLEDALYTDGAGTDVALAALHCGRTAQEAVELCAKLIPKYIGGGVDTITFAP